MDALIFEDLAYLAEKPSFGHILENGARVERVRSIYPALTYPCHATMASGCWPAKHGVVNNKAMIPGQKDSAGNWFHHIYKTSDLFDGAKAKGLTTACVGWPTMGCHPNIDYLVAEIAWTKAKTEEEYNRWKSSWERWETATVDLVNIEILFVRYTLGRVEIGHMANKLLVQKILDSKYLIYMLAGSQAYDPDLVTVDWRYQFEDVEFKTMY